MKKKGARAALYLRVSTGEQTVENQRRELAAAAAQRGWLTDQTAIYTDNGISGAKGRDERPALDRMLKDVLRGKIDVIMAWSVDRLGRSLIDLLGTLQELHGAACDLYLHKQAIDTTTPSGRAMFQMLGVFSEFEREIIRERVNAGIARAQAAGKHCGRPKASPKLEAAIRARLEAGEGMTRISRDLGVGSSTVQRVAKELRASAA